MEIFIKIILFYIITELILYFFIFKSRNIKWILTNNDLIKLFINKRFNKFKNTNYNYFLGWDKKENTSGLEICNDKQIKYSIDKKGYRSSNFKSSKNKIITFGDSYTFCRQVNNDSTWQELASSRTVFISNFGVGNYGLDQSYLKYKSKKIKGKNKIIIFGFVPETICRIQSAWKHFFEFGNIHGFKPFCVLKNDKLVLKRNILKKSTTLKNIHKVIEKLKTYDRFYKEKYCKHIIKFPFVFSFLNNIKFNIHIFILIMFNISFDKRELEKKIFPVIMRNNIIKSHSLYNEVYSQKLLKKLMMQIHNDVNRNNHKCIFLVFPQFYDLKLSSRRNYQDFFNKLGKDVKILDLTNKFLQKKNFDKFFTNDKYGGHLNLKGNKIVSKVLKDYAKDI